MMKTSIVKHLCSIRRASCLALALCLFAPVLLHAEPARQILIVHSYSQEYPLDPGSARGLHPNSCSRCASGIPRQHRVSGYQTTSL